MWFFRCPEIFFGQGALDHLSEIEGRRALIVTDANILALGYVEAVQTRLTAAGIESEVLADIEPDPSLETVRRGAARALACEPDWIVALGGGSCIDAAKSIWIQYERPDLAPDEVAPMGRLGLRQKARLVAIPTTSGTGADVTWAIVLTDHEETRKLSLGHSEAIPDLTIVDPEFVRDLPPQVTADTGMDVLTHAVEGYTSRWHNDFTDGLCLKAIQLVFDYLPRAYRDGARDEDARERMHNAATIAGLGFGNSWPALAHGLGHALGALLPIPHGRAVGLCLPYTIEFVARGEEATRYAEIARFLVLPAGDEVEASTALAGAIRDLAQRIDQPTSLQEAGISREQFEANLPLLVTNSVCDGSTIGSWRCPDEEEAECILQYIFEGRSVDF